jgi:tetratricopeptide (TPR) repeat protein
MLAEGGEAVPYYQDGAFFMPLTAVTDTDLLVTAVAQALGLQQTELVSPQQQILSYLQDKEMLLIGDNFEQVAGGAALMAKIVAAAPKVQLLLTSQQPLNIQAERRFVITGLDFADSSETSEAAQLFLASARRVNPDFQLVETHLPALLELCRLLDGMPLALEIAAGWVRMMDCPTILQQTKRSLDFLVSPLQDMPARHQSMRAVLAQSWQLLSLEMQEALRRIALFAGGFRLEAALATMPDFSMVDLAALLDKSLLIWRPDGRYHMHQLLRTFVRQQAQSPEQQQEETLFRQRYGRYYLEFVAGQEGELRGQNSPKAIATIQEELSNLRQAFRLALAERMVGVLTQAMSGLGRFYHLMGLFEEAEQGALTALMAVEEWGMGVAEAEKTAVFQTHLHLQASHFLGQGSQFRKAIQQAKMAQALAKELDRVDLLARAFSLEGEWQRHMSELVKARECLETAVSLHPTPSRNRDYAHTLNQLGQIHIIQSQYDEALVALNQARQVYEMLGDQTEMWGSLGNMAEIYRLKADYTQALAYSQQALAVAEAIGYKQAIVKNSIILCMIQIDQGELDLARTTAHNALLVAKGLGYLQGIINCHICLGNVSTSQGKLDEAVQWLKTARLQAEEVGLQDLIAMVMGRMGIIHAHRGEHEAAILAYQQAIQLWRLLDNQLEFGRNLANLGSIYLRSGEYERALSYYEQGLAAMQAIGARQSVANMMVRMGNVYKRIGNYERAIAYFEQSLAIYEVIQHKSGMALNLGWLGVMHNEMGQYEAALARYEQARILSEEVGDQITLAIWLMNSAEVSMHLGQREAAERLVQQAVALCRTLGNSRFLPGAIIHQAQILFEHGKYEQAQLVLREALSLSESVADQQLQFDGRLLQTRLLYQLGEEETAVTQLHAMIADFAGDEYQAQLHYYLWQMNGDEEVRETAVSLYEIRLAQTPNYKLQQQLKTLLDSKNGA